MTGEKPFSEYYRATVSKPVTPIYTDLDPYLPAHGRAIDLGCGAGRGVLHLLERGLHVTATEEQAEGLEYLRSLLPPDADADLVNEPFQTLRLDTYDVAVASYSLFFLPPAEFGVFWARLVNAIVPGGLFAGQFLGPNDDWADTMTVHARADVERLFEGFDVLSLKEEDQDGSTAVGTTKHWHVFHVIARRGGVAKD